MVEQFGLRVEYDPSGNRLSVRNGSDDRETTIQSTIKINGNPVTLFASPEMCTILKDQNFIISKTVTKATMAGIEIGDATAFTEFARSNFPSQEAVERDVAKSVAEIVRDTRYRFRSVIDPPIE